MGLTEPGAGSDAASLRTTAVKKGDRYILNGSKTFITNAPVADVMVVFANANPSKKHEGITAFIVEKGTPGLSTGKPFHKMGCRCSATSEVFFEDCEVPEENVLAGEGKGWLIALSGVEWDRCTLLAPMLGAALNNLDACARYANERHQFNRPIRSFQAIQHRIADMKVFVEASRLAIYRVAWAKDNGTMLNPLQAAVSKLYAGDRGFEMASEAVQVFGGYGFMHEYPVETKLPGFQAGRHRGRDIGYHARDRLPDHDDVTGRERGSDGLPVFSGTGETAAGAGRFLPCRDRPPGADARSRFAPGRRGVHEGEFTAPRPRRMAGGGPGG